MQLTYLDSNSWLLEIAQKRILLDPWLVGDLVFGNLPWLFKAQKKSQRPIPENIDLILLSQGLEDHAHPPTLKALDHDLPVVGSPNAAKVVKELGYTQVRSLAHGESYILDETIVIKAVPGSPIGPMLTENGYLIRDLTSGVSLYYEPHGYHSADIKESAPIDVVITPLVTLKIPFLGAVIQGHKTALEAVKSLQPQFILPTAAGGDVDFDGVLLSILKGEGTVEEFQSQLRQENLVTKVISPVPGEPVYLEIKASVAI